MRKKYYEKKINGETYYGNYSERPISKRDKKTYKEQGHRVRNEKIKGGYIRYISSPHPKVKEERVRRLLKTKKYKNMPESKMNPYMRAIKRKMKK